MLLLDKIGFTDLHSSLGVLVFMTLVLLCNLSAGCVPWAAQPQAPCHPEEDAEPRLWLWRAHWLGHADTSKGRGGEFS